MLGMPTFDLTSERGKQDFQKWITFAIKNEINSYSRQVLNIDNTGAGGGGGSPTGPAGGGLTGEYPDPLIYPDMTGITSINTPQIISFNTINPGVAAIGALVWNDTNGTLEFGLKGGNVNLSIGQENVALVKHADNSGLVKGKVVYVAGSDGSNKTVRYALATSDATSARTFGVMAESATGGNKAFVATQGIVSDIDTSALTEGAAVYVSPSVAGDLTSTKPSAPDHIVLVGFCVRSHAVNGVLYVTVVNGFELDELHDVKITSKQNGDIIKYNSSTGVWENVASDDIPAHASTHEFGGSDEIEIAPSQVTGTAVITSDSRLTDARTPLDASVTSPKFNIDYASPPTVSQAGALYYNTSSNKLFVWDGSAWDEVGAGSGVPIGTIIWTGQTTIPTGFLDCDGSSQLRSAYPDLFSVIGTTYGQGSNPGTTFALPNISSTTGNYVICAQLSPTVYTSDALFTAPLGSMIQWPVTTGYPTGWLRADGSAVSRTSYADLFSIIGTTYGSGDGSTTFNLPNMPSAGTGSPVTLIKALLSGTVEPSTVAHAASHTQGGSDVITVTGNQIANYQSNRNLFINGNFSVWQRGTAATVSTGYWADRWSAYSTSSQERSTNVPTAAGFQYSLQFSRSGSGTNGIYQRIEGANCTHLNGKTVTVSFWAQSGSGSDAVNVLFYYANALDTWTSSTLIGSVQATASISSSWTRYSASITLPSNVTNGLQVNIERAGSTTPITRITGIQLEIGNVSTPFEFESFDTTLRKCQRYYQKSVPHDLTNFTTLAANSSMAQGTCWISTGSGGGGVRIVFPVHMRAEPTVNFTSWTSANTNVANGGTFTAHIPGIGDANAILEQKSSTGLSVYSTETNRRQFFFWNANAEL